MDNKSRKKIITFLLLVVFMSIIPTYNIYKLQDLDSTNVFIIMWIPTVSAVITKLVFDKTLRGLGFRFPKFKYIAISYFIPLIAGLIVYGITWASKLGGIDTAFLNKNISGVIPILSFLFWGVFLSILSAIGEEIGWRGFLVPELFKNFSYVKTSLIMSLIWSLYHYPLMILGNYNNGVSILSSFVFFTISIVAICFITTWLRLKSKSLWPSTVLHATHNYFVQAVFDVMTIDNKPYTKIFTTEFGIGLAVIYSLTAIYFFRRRSELKNVQ